MARIDIELTLNESSKIYQVIVDKAFIVRRELAHPSNQFKLEKDDE